MITIIAKIILKQKHIFTIGILLLVLLVLLIPSSSAANVSAVSKNVTPGQSFNLIVRINPLNNPIAGAQLDIAFDNSHLRINRITEGNLFKQNGSGTYFNAGNINNSAGNAVNIFNAILGKSNVTTPGTFIIINMTAIAPSGMSRIRLSNVKISDLAGSKVDLKVFNGTIRINNPPVFGILEDKTIYEGQTLEFNISATDTDNDVLRFSSSHLPSGASFNAATRTFVWKTDYDQSGIYPNVSFRVTDGVFTVYKNITISVIDVNMAPTFNMTPLNGSIFNETDKIQVNITANDPDNDQLSYIIKIDGVQACNTSSYIWTTNCSSSGYHSIEASVADAIIKVIRNTTIYIADIYSRNNGKKRCLGN